jgi:hypothetical protein
LTYTFVPFAVLLCAALLYAELARDLVLFRGIYTIRACILLSIPALCLSALTDLRKVSWGVYNAWRLLWLFAFLIYLAHFLYSVGAFFEWDIGQIYAKQGAVTATTNFAVTLLWGIEVCAVWCCFRRRPKSGLYLGQVLIHLLVLVAVIVSSVTKTSWIQYAGYALIAIIPVCLVLRFSLGDLSREFPLEVANA